MKHAALWIIVGLVLLVGLSSFVRAEQQVCCSETISGEKCGYVPASECKPDALQAATSCEQTSFCSLGCGFVQDEGRCFNNMPKFSCENTAGCSWTPEASCNIPQCQRGCCILSNECSFVTQLECKQATSMFSNVNMTFKEEITSELECTNQCRSFERGACVAPDASCIFTTRESCPHQTPSVANFSKPAVGFHPNKLCSQPDLGTECARQQKTGCLPEEDAVYWFDSCGNPENVYDANKQKSFNNGYVLAKEESCNFGQNNVNNPTCGNCNYPLGSLCLLAERNNPPTYGQYICGDLSCGLDDIIQDPNAPASGSPKKLGESWCAYDGPPGFGQDKVGSRQYRRLCINGEELTEPCKDFREEMCVQGLAGEEPFETTASFKIKEGDYINAACRTNRWEGCGRIKDEYNCNNVLVRDCYWIGQHVNDPNKQRENTEGTCVPLVPPGLKFWPEESTGKTPGADASATCTKGNNKCTVVYEKPGVGLFGGGEKCIGNCECESKDWLLAMNTICVSQGDCGAWVNTLGKGTPDGFQVSSNHPNRLNDQDIARFGKTLELTQGERQYDGFSAFFSRSALPLLFLGGQFAYGSLSYGVNAGWQLASTTSLEGLGKDLVGQGFANAIESEALKTATTNLVAAQAKQAAEQVAFDTATKAGAAVLQEKIALETATTAVKTASQGVESAIAESTPLFNAPLLGALNTIMWAWTIYNVFDVLLADTEEITYEVTCQPWVAPATGSDCEKCNEPGKECSEYKCKSLGQTCELVNQGTENELCVNKHPNDVNPPVISANRDALASGFTLTEKAGEGYEVNQLIPPFTPVQLGIVTDEPSQCKWDLKNSLAYDTMTEYFGDSLYDYNHTMIFNVPDAFTQEEILKLTNGGKYTLYVRCQDGGANKNTRDYYIKFAVEVGPDLTAPVIELTSIANGAYVPADVNQTALTIYTNEPSDCKWSTIDEQYEKMLNVFTCDHNPLPTSSLYYGLYDCTTVLTGIQQNKKSDYYFRCKDQPGKPEEQRNVNSQSYLFSLQGTIPLLITNVQPLPGTELFDPDVELKVVTSAGAQGGIAVCGYSFIDNNPANAIDFANTNSTVHTQQFTDLQTGFYNAYITCFDVAGNMDQDQTNFTVSVDTQAPQLSQIFTEGSLLVIVTDEPSTCEYSNTGAFTFGSGVRMTGEMTFEHQATLDKPVYYIACIDKFDNIGNYVVYV